MEDSKIRKLQKVELEILKEADRVCKLLNIDYYLIGGTLLGAVRHGGFIPWDNDIDIAMKRDDYEAFRKYWEKENSGKYFYQDYKTEQHHTQEHALLRLKGTHMQFVYHQTDKYSIQCDGIFLDIFPLDYAPTTSRKQKAQQRKIKALSNLVQAKISRNYYGTGKLKYAVKKILAVFLKPVPFKYLHKKIEKVMIKYNHTDSPYLVSMASHYSYKKQLMLSEVYGKPKKIKFEGLDFSAPEQTDVYLKQIYGDYMKLPSEESRHREMDSVVIVDYGAYDLSEE